MDQQSLNTSTQKPRVLILGGSGMLGHKIWFNFKNTFDTYVTLRQPFEEYTPLNIFEAQKSFANVDVKDREKLETLIADLKPDVIINCIGIVKQLPSSKDPILSIKINSLLPHELEKICKLYNSKLIHISTDCIFEGGKGNYSEEEPSRVDDLYGITKLLGEVNAPPTLTLRTSIIGRELSRHAGLLEWFLSRRPKEKIQGYQNAIFSGFTTTVLAKTLSWIIQNHIHLTGIYHLSSYPISKYELLKKLQKAFKMDIELIPFEDYYCDRSLNANHFNKETGFIPPSWDEMIAGLKEEDPFYKEITRVARR